MSQTTTQTSEARKFLRYALNNGVGVWVAYGQMEIEGFVLSVTKQFAEIQSSTDGQIVKVALMAIDEMVEV